MVRIIIIICCLSGCAVNDEWTKTDSKLEFAFQAVNLADAYTTMRIRHVHGIYEQSWPTAEIIGSQPTEKDVALLFVTYGIGHYLISRALPTRFRRYYQVGTIVYSSALIINNCERGLC